MFLGYKYGVKGYIAYDLKTNDIFLTRDAYFHEKVLPFKDKKLNQIAYGKHPSGDFIHVPCLADEIHLVIPSVESNVDEHAAQIIRATIPSNDCSLDQVTSMRL